MTANYYDLLGVKSNATFEEIKRAYHAAALAHHPDKNASLSEADAMSPDIFQQVQKAWGVLKNSDTRSTYDRHLAGQRMVDQVVVSEEIALDEMACQELEGVCEYSYPCRCGDYYQILSEDLEEDFRSMIVACSSCSLNIRVDWDEAVQHKEETL
ncbi:hypothetical protein CYMTET_56239 [Cymbomonas tetramitiformis]|uniref:Diphthamide biosynthesis protein 4 n=1 Tax=Cymbomonas tetramitiformis TaxID=36881 RepID=A0AAE0EMR9_9CHLO|nr:hypothetical protein CYMTET_56239 [Cymbomonas tetramitiformis]